MLALSQRLFKRAASNFKTYRHDDEHALSKLIFMAGILP